MKYFARQVYPSIVTAKVLDQFTSLTKKSIQQHISDLITERLKTALTKEGESNKETALNELTPKEGTKIVTTDDELEAFMIVKSILRRNVDVKRLAYRDAQSYFAVLLDDNNRKTVCRLYFSMTSDKKSVTVFGENKKEMKFDIGSLEDIFDLSDELMQSVAWYDNQN